MRVITKILICTGIALSLAGCFKDEKQGTCMRIAVYSQNVERPAESRNTPDEVALFDAEAEYQVALELWSLYTFAVVVDKANKIYAYRTYETPMNLAEVFTQLHMYAWRKTGNANGWTVVNPFPDEAREPLVPVEDDSSTTE